MEESLWEKEDDSTNLYWMYIEISIQIIVLPTIFLKDFFLVMTQVHWVVAPYLGL